MSNREIIITKDQLTRYNFKVLKQELNLILKCYGLEKIYLLENTKKKKNEWFYVN